MKRITLRVNGEHLLVYLDGNDAEVQSARERFHTRGRAAQIAVSVQRPEFDPARSVVDINLDVVVENVEDV